MSNGSCNFQASPPSSTRFQTLLNPGSSHLSMLPAAAGPSLSSYPTLPPALALFHSSSIALPSPSCRQEWTASTSWLLSRFVAVRSFALVLSS